MSNQEMLRSELLACMWRYSKESNVTVFEAIKAAHEAAERIFQITLDAKSKDGEL
jgi:hypothetical protein